MKWVCPDCDYESDNPGNCPTCGTPLLQREDEEIEKELEEMDEEELSDLDDDDEGLE